MIERPKTAEGWAGMDEKPRRGRALYADRVGPLAEDTRGAANGRVNPSNMLLSLGNYFKAEKMRRPQG
jgi:hypothetical protein